MIESVDSLKQLGLKAVPSIVFIATFTWFNAQMDNKFNLLSERIGSVQTAMESKIESMNTKIEANEKVNSMRFEMIKTKIDLLSERVGRVENDINNMRNGK